MNSKQTSPSARAVISAAGRAVLLALGIGLVALPLRAQVTFNASGAGNTYEVISSALGGNPMESPDCAHTDGFGRHITEEWDAVLGKFVFVFHMHVVPDGDLCTAVDRQRNEIKAYGPSKSYVKGFYGDFCTYRWKFKLDDGFQPSPNFCHIHQLKAGDGSDSGSPIMTITPRHASPQRLELIYTAPSGLSGSGTKMTAPLADFKGQWIEAHERILYATNGTYEITLRRVSDGVVLMAYTNNNINMWRGDATFIRPKWGIYRSLNSPSYLRDEQVRFADFCLAKGSDGCSSDAGAPLLFNVKDYGATGNGTTIDTPAIHSAILAAHNAGGGTVVFPEGNYASVSIRLTNNVTLYLSNNAVILAANTTGMDFPEPNPWSSYQDFGHSHFRNALIWGENLTNIGITGPGTISGDAKITNSNSAPDGQADKAISLKRCTNVVISGVTITRAGHFAILANGCYNFTMTNANILNATLTSHRDGINLINSSHCYIANCRIEGSDDALCLKADFAVGEKLTSTNIVVENCTILSTQNNATQFGSETIGDFYNVRFSNITILGAGKAGIGITSNDGSIIDGVTYENITMTNCASPIHIKLSNQNRPSSDPHPVGRIRNISINNVTAIHSTQSGRTNTATIAGYGSSGESGSTTNIPIENIVLRNVDIQTIGGLPSSTSFIVPDETQAWQPNSFGPNGVRPAYGWYIRHAKNISFENCRVRWETADGRPALIADDVEGLKLDGFIADVNDTGPNASPYDLGFTNVTAYEVVNSTSAGGGALRMLSAVSTAHPVVSPPVFSPGGGAFANSQSVTLSSATAGAAIRYTTNGITPTPDSGMFYSGPLNIGTNAFLKAVAYLDGMTNSAVNTAIYTFGNPIAPPPPPQSVFAFEAESLAYVTNGAVAALQNDANNSGGRWLALLATGAGEFIEYTLPNIPAGIYQFQMSYKSHQNRGVLQLALDGNILGGDLDQYSNPPGYPTHHWGTVVFPTNGNHVVRLTVVGKNPAAGAFTLSVDQFILTLHRPLPPLINDIHPLGDGLVLNASRGFPGWPFHVLSATNLALPLTNWSHAGSGWFDANGNCAWTNPVNSTLPEQYYLLQMP